MAKNKKLKAFAPMLGVGLLVALMATGCYHGGDVPDGAIPDVTAETTVTAEEPAIHPSGNQETAQEPESPQESEQQNTQQQPQTQPQTQTQTQQDQQQQTSVVYEDVTVAAGEDYAPDVRATDVAQEYKPAAVECSKSPNGYHSWSSVYEWYGVNEEGSEYLINTGTYPEEGAYVNSAYLYDVCDYCGEIR